MQNNIIQTNYITKQNKSKQTIKQSTNNKQIQTQITQPQVQLNQNHKHNIQTTLLNTN